MATRDPQMDEKKLKQRYLRVSKILLLTALIYTLWIALITIGVYFLKLGNKWAIMTIEQWILSALVLLSVAIIFEIFFLLHYTLIRGKQEPLQQQKATYLKGKQVHSYTLPAGAKGGIYSKTYIMIDEIRILNLRYQIIPPNDLWGQQQ